MTITQIMEQVRLRFPDAPPSVYEAVAFGMELEKSRILNYLSLYTDCQIPEYCGGNCTCGRADYAISRIEAMK